VKIFLFVLLINFEKKIQLFKFPRNTFQRSMMPLLNTADLLIPPLLALFSDPPSSFSQDQQLAVFTSVSTPDYQLVLVIACCCTGMMLTFARGRRRRRSSSLQTTHGTCSNMLTQSYSLFAGQGFWQDSSAPISLVTTIGHSRGSWLSYVVAAMGLISSSSSSSSSLYLSFLSSFLPSGR
jgi:hypothetical protein